MILFLECFFSVIGYLVGCYLTLLIIKTFFPKLFPDICFDRVSYYYGLSINLHRTYYGRKRKFMDILIEFFAIFIDLSIKIFIGIIVSIFDIIFYQIVIVWLIASSCAGFVIFLVKYYLNPDEIKNRAYNIKQNQVDFFSSDPYNQEEGRNEYRVKKIGMLNILFLSYYCHSSTNFLNGGILVRRKIGSALSSYGIVLVIGIFILLNILFPIIYQVILPFFVSILSGIFHLFISGSSSISLKPSNSDPSKSVILFFGYSLILYVFFATFMPVIMMLEPEVLIEFALSINHHANSCSCYFDYNRALTLEIQSWKDYQQRQNEIVKQSESIERDKMRKTSGILAEDKSYILE